VDLPADLPTLAALARRLEDALAGLGAATTFVRGAGHVVAGGAALAGLAALTVAGRAERALSGLGGAAAGALGAYTFRSALSLHLGLSLPFTALALGALCGVLSAALPRLFPFVAAAVPAAAVGLSVPLLGRPWAGALAAALVAGALAAAFARGVSVVLASFGGGLLLAVGGLALLDGYGLAAAAASRPLVVVGFAVVLAVAGTALQLERRPRPDLDTTRPADRSLS